MKHKILTLILLLFPYLVWADSQEFKLNDKPVPEVVARVNGTALYSAQLQTEFISFRLQAQAQGEKITPSEETLIARELLKAVIMKELIAQKALSLNIKITPEKVDLEIKNIEDKFPSHSAFITALAIQRTDIKALKEKIKRTLLEDELIRLEIIPKIKLRDDAARKFYNSNKEKFSKPVLYGVRHILITIIPSPKKLEDEASHKKALRIAKMINDEAKLKAEEVLQRIKTGDDFIKLANKFSEDEASKKEGGMLGHLHPDSTLPEIAAEMVKLNEGETSNIIQSPFGYHIIKLDEIIPSTLIPFEESESDILNILMKREAQGLFKNYLIDLEKNSKIEIFI
tara:strand:+ start:735 stop:1760 length:1026 start_codon:yes stop_codon:yes gene_type:complete